MMVSFVLASCGPDADRITDAATAHDAASYDAAEDGALDTGVDAAPPSHDGSLDTGPDAFASDAVVCPDHDGDGHALLACGGDDCDDTSATIHPGVHEDCNGRDDDCDNLIDEDPASATCVVAHGSAVCAAGACSLVSCDAGYTPGAGGCVDVAPPRQLAPLSTSVVTSSRPTLHWELSPGTDGARIELCHERSCGTPFAVLTVVGTSAVPIAPIGAGVVYWRVFGRAGASLGTTPSPVWQLRVRHRSAPIDTSFGTELDVDGDGYDELAVGAWGSGQSEGYVYLYPGGAAGLGTTASLTLSDHRISSYYGAAVASAGDVNGDGFADLAIGAWHTDVNRGTLWIHLGGATGLSPTAVFDLPGPDSYGGEFATTITSGDFDGDGYSDVAVGAVAAGPRFAGRVHVFRGSADAMDRAPAWTIYPTFGGGFGNGLASTDLNGDQRADLIVGQYPSGTVSVFLGRSAGLPAAPDVTLFGAQSFGVHVAAAGDVDGDGYGDLVVSELEADSYAGRAYFFRGGPSGLASSTGQQLATPTLTTRFGTAATCVGDVDADGYDDFVVGSESEWFFLYRGSASGPVEPPTRVNRPGAVSGGGFGRALSGGDIDGDGFSDVSAGANIGWSAYLFRGSASGLVTSGPTTLTESNEQYGSVVCSR